MTLAVINNAADATVVVSVVVGLFGLWQIIYSKRSERRLMEYQQQVHRDNSEDHGGTMDKMTILLDHQAELRDNHDEIRTAQRELRVVQQEIHTDVQAIRLDVRDLATASRQHDKRIDDLEDRDPPPSPPFIFRAV